MALRLAEGMTDPITTLNHILTAPGLLSSAQNFAEKTGYFAQQFAQNLVDPTVWLAAEMYGNETVYPRVYEEALARTGDQQAAEAEADAAVIAYADRVIRDTQSPMRPSDIAEIEAHGPYFRMLTQFTTYFNNMYNLLSTEMHIAQNSDLGWNAKAGRQMYVYLMIVTIPSVVAQALSSVAAGDLDDPDEWDEVMFDILIGSQVKTMFNMVPVAGSALSMSWNQIATSGTWDDRLSLGTGAGTTESTITGLIHIVTALTDPDVDLNTKTALRGVMNGIAIATGLPTNWLRKPMAYAIDVREGRADPEGLVDVIQGALTGRDGTR